MAGIIQFDPEIRFHGGRIAHQEVKMLLRDSVEERDIFIRAGHKENICQSDL